MDSMFVLPAQFGLVTIPVGLSWFVNFWHAGKVMAARKAFGVDYPNMYADPKTIKAEDADSFNQIQRAHQNFLEALPITLALMFSTALFHPVLATGAGSVWLVGRLIYAIGYFKNPKGRVPGAVISMLSQVTLTVATLYFAVRKYF